MTSPAPANATLAGLLSEVIDDAGLFPPAALDLEDALAGHLRARQGDFSWMLGRFVCPATLAPGIAPGVRLCVVAAGIDEVMAVIGLPNVEVVELRPPDGAPRQAAIELADALAPAGIAGFVEVAPRAESVAELAGTGVGVKLRCGGVTAEAFPSPEALAEAIGAAGRHRLHLKATAGLHHPVRRHDPTLGVQMHGFLNVAAAIVAADAGARPAEVQAVLREEDPSRFVAGAAGFGWGPFVADPPAVRRIRATRFAGFGSCSFVEPVDDLIALGMLDPGRVLAG